MASGVEDDSRTGFLVSFLDARAEGHDAEVYLSAAARRAYERYGDAREGMESRALYALWQYRIEQRTELDDGTSDFSVMEEGHERASPGFAGYIHEHFIVRANGSGLEIDVTESIAVTAF